MTTFAERSSDRGDEQDGAGSLVTKDIPPYVLAVGNPARVIRELPRDLDLAARLNLAEEAGAIEGMLQK